MLKLYKYIIATILLITSATSVFAANPQITSSQTTTELMQGDTLETPIGRLTIIDKLGEGYFGMVYSVENEAGEKYAIKCYKHPSTDSHEMNLLNDAEREFRRGQQLDHPNIVKSIALFPYQFQDGQEGLILILQFIEGDPLFKYSYSALDRQIIHSIFKFVDALKYALALDLVHLDLHGGNVMIDSQIEPKVIDLASFFDFDELLFHASTYSEELSENPKQEAKNATVAAAAKHLAPIRKKAQPVPVQHPEKIKKLFREHPELLSQLKKRMKAKKGAEGNRQKIAMNKSLYTAAKTEEQPVTEDVKAPILSYYYRSIGNICSDMVFISNLSKDEKIAMRVEIMKLVWDYAYAIEEGESPNFDTYIDKLISLLLIAGDDGYQGRL